MKRNFVLLLAAIVLFGLAAGQSFSGVPLVISHQGRLLNSADQPVTGNRDLTFRIYTDPTGGTLLWTESHPSVSVTNGLFKVALGATTPLTYDIMTSTSDPSSELERYLEVQVASDPPLLPRMRMGSTSYALSSGRVTGDVTTSPGQVSLSGMSGSTTATIRSSNNPGTPGSSLEMTDQGEPSVVVTSDPDVSSMQLKAYRPGRPTFGNITFESSQNRDYLYSQFQDGDIPNEMEFENKRFSVAVNLNERETDEDHTASLTADSGASEVKIKHTPIGGGMSGSTTGTIRASSIRSALNISDDRHLLGLRSVSASADSAASTILLEADLDGDGVMERNVWQKVDNSVASVSTSSRFASGPRQTTSQDGTFSDAQTLVATDMEDNGIPDIGISSRTSADSAVQKSFFERGDKPTQSQFSNTIDSYGVRSLFNSRNGSTTGTIKMMANPDSEVSVLGYDGDNDGNFHTTLKGISRNGGSSYIVTWDSNDDGIADNVVENSSDAAGARSILSGHMGSTTGTIRMQATPDSAKVVCDKDDDGDGNPEDAITILIHETAGPVVLLLTDSNDDGKPEYGVEEACNGADASAKLKLFVDKNSDGTINGSQELKSSATGVSHTFSWDSDADGVIDRAKGEVCDDNGSGESFIAGVAIPKFIDITARESSLTGEADVSMVMGLGSDSLVELGADDTGTSLSMKDKSGTYTLGLVVTDATGLVSMTNGLGATSLQLDAEGRIGLGGAADASNPIHHSSGAHLSAAGDWVNASDKNSKENFTKVDGAEILEKIENLPITEWNYKSQGDDVRHIGPTAQDFQSAFGVGSDDKSISTVDPSGIALAAIKELYKQLKNKDAELKELKEEISKLKKHATDGGANN